MADADPPEADPPEADPPEADPPEADPPEADPPDADPPDTDPDDPAPADSEPDDTASDRQVAAPGLRETADIWFDTGRDPVVTWDVEVRRFLLADPVDPEHTLTLLVTERAVRHPDRVARVLAEGLAACDFPPTEDRASQRNVERALRAAGLDPAQL